MDDIQNYQIEVRGHLNEKDLNTTSPLLMKSVRTENDHPDASTLLTVCTDQSGLIGLLRHLHARGISLLSVQRER